MFDDRVRLVHGAGTWPRTQYGGPLQRTGRCFRLGLICDFVPRRGGFEIEVLGAFQQLVFILPYCVLSLFCFPRIEIKTNISIRNIIFFGNFAKYS